MKTSWRRVRAAGTAAFLVAALAASASAQFCSNCILNQAGPQSAQFNVTSGTVRGVLTVGSLNLADLTASGTMTAALFAGSGASLTALNASALASGTVPSARVVGSYTGVTGLGTLTVGTWNASAIGTQYGGTGQNFSTVGAGSIPWFSNTGTMAAIPSPSFLGVLESTGTGGKPVWVSSPALNGANFINLQLSALAAGNLPQNVAINDASISTVSAAKVVGNIAGLATGLSTSLPINQLASGTLSTANPASSVTASGVQVGTFGGPSTLAQFRVGYDGRLYDAKQFNIVVYSTGIAPGTLPPGVLLPAAQVSAGTLASNVVASSVAASGITPGTYGGPALTLVERIGIDGRVSTITVQSIALPLAQLNNGTLPSGVLVPAASIQAGSLANNVIVSSVAANGVSPGTYGNYSYLPQFVVGADGRITSATNLYVASLSTSAAVTDRDNNWHHAQTSVSSWTINADLLVNGQATANFFSGNGSLLTSLNASQLTTGTIPAARIGTGAIDTTKLAADAVTTAKILDANVTTAKLANGAVDTTKLASDAVTTAKILNGNVTNAKLADGSVDTAKLASDAVTTVKILNAAVTGAKIAANTITNSNVASGAFSNITGVGTQGQALDMGTHLINNVTDPASAQDAATKAYVDALASGIQWKAAARLATTAALPTNLYGNGSSGVGATLTGTALGALTVDSVAVAVGNRILVKDESSGSHNGIYTVTQNGAGVVYILTRATDYDTAAKMEEGTAVFVTAGTVNADMGFVQINTITTVGTDALSFTQFTGLGEITAGAGLTKTANTISIANLGVTTAMLAASAVDTTKIATDAITTIKILDANVTTAKIAANAVDTTKLALGAVTTNVLANSAVDTTKLATDAVTNVKILNGTIDLTAKVTGSLPIANGGTALTSAGSTANRVLRTSNGTSFVVGQVIGPDIAASTIPVGALNQSGASDTNVLAWSNSASAWVPSSAAAGDAVKSATQTFSGYDTFASSIAIGSQVVSTTATYTSVMNGGLSLVAYSSFTAASGAYIYGLKSNADFLVKFDFNNSASANINMTIQDATSSHYGGAFCTDTNGTAINAVVSNAAALQLNGSATSFGSSSIGPTGDFWISNGTADGSVIGYGLFHYFPATGGSNAVCTESMRWNGSTSGAPFKIKIFPASGTMTGHIKVYMAAVVQPF